MNKVLQNPVQIGPAYRPPLKEIRQTLPRRNVIIQILPAVNRTSAAGKEPSDPVCGKHLVLIILF